MVKYCINCKFLEHDYKCKFYKHNYFPSMSSTTGYCKNALNNEQYKCNKFICKSIIIDNEKYEIYKDIIDNYLINDYYKSIGRYDLL